MRFAVIDLETANARMHSICQIGIVVFEGGREVAADVALINPRDVFDAMNVGIHGITMESVADALLFADVHGQIARALRDQVVVSHGHFDRVALEQACDHHGADRLACRWLDSLTVARQTWPQLAGGHGLRNLAGEFGISFQHHDALEDARAAGHVLLRAIEHSGIDLPGWLDRAPIGGGRHSGRITRTGDGDGPLLEESVVFTGELLSMDRKDAADLAHVAGAAVEGGVTRNTTMLVVGALDPEKKTVKWKKAAQLIAAGQAIRIVDERDFVGLVQG